MEQLIVADAEHNLSFLSAKTITDDSIASTRPLLAADRTIVGHNDEILDLKVIPSSSQQTNTAPSSERIVVATNSAQVRLFELGTYSCEVLDGHSATVLCVDASPCGRYLATCGKDKTMRLWHLETQRCIGVATGHTEAIGAAALSRKVGRYDVKGKAAINGGGSFAVTASKDRTLKRWNLPGSDDLDKCALSEDPLELRAFVSARAHEKDINIISVAPNDSLVATGSQDKTVKLWRSTDLTLQGTLKGHRRGVWDCQFSPFDRVIATSSADRTVKLWSLSDYSCVRTFQGHVSSALRVRFLSGGLQLVSSGADGLIKVWTIRTNECETTMDGHSDKVWALDLSPSSGSLVTGGADSRIVVWNDTTQEEENAKRDAEEQTIMMEQRLANHLRFKEYEQALEIALELDKPRQALKVLNSIIENDLQQGQGQLVTLKRHVQSWPMSRTSQVLRYCREWNTRARNSHVAMLVVKSIVSSIPAHELAAADGVPEIMAGITPYAERHFDRFDRLHASSYLLDFTLFSMGAMDNTDEDGNLETDYAAWEASSKLVLPPKHIDGRIQVGGKDLVGETNANQDDSSEDDDDSENEVLTVGESDADESSSSEDDDSSVDDDNDDQVQGNTDSDESSESISDSD
uniref:U3 small nucleolar RNA-associated protein 13 C-terminal domain-containing protein n=1 Tax=Asterionellopsis glacialis TaxID=33640 RepID=A0A7S0PX60_9STRA|mmetsp:Transcript_409/g.565  ORF Transcript_409/g.565 Transcript_409/m.565 type:complete len:634 (+) Transcript_409:1-1902(+)